jgi:hypothetical protein
MMQDDQNYRPKLDPMAQDVLEEDCKFLNALLQKQNQDDYQEGNSFCAPVQYIGKNGTIDSIRNSVPRAELVCNSEIVRRGQLIAHNRAVKYKRQRITP